MNTGAKPILSGGRLELPNELLLLPPILFSLSLTPLPCTVLPGFSICAQLFFCYFFFLFIFLSHSTSSGAKLHIKSLI